MAFAIMRVGENEKKLKTMQNIAALGMHCHRLRETPNADPLRRHLNQALLGSEHWERDVEARLLEVLPKVEKNGVHMPKVRSNGVLAGEHLFTASPEAFAVLNLEDWTRRNLEWLWETYGRENVVSAVLHLDETTPNLHALVVPIDRSPTKRHPEGRPRLNARGFWGGPQKLRALQDSYAKAMEPFHLARGVRGSVRHHEEVKHFYGRMGEPATRAREKLQRAVFADEIAPQLEAALQQVEELSRKLEQQERQIAAQAKRERLAQPLVDRVRQVDLKTVMETLGAVRDPADTSGRRWQFDGEEITISGQKFYNLTRERGGGGAIDLVLAVRPEYTFPQAVAFLRDEVGPDAAVLAAARHAEQAVEHEPPLPFRAPEPNSQNWSQIRSYLTEKLRLPQPWIDALHDRGVLYSDIRDHAVFLRTADQGEATGATRCSTSYESGSPGPTAQTRRDAGYFQVTLPGHEGGHTWPVLILAETPIEALSYLELHRRLSEGRESGPVTVMSMDGAAPPHQRIEGTLREGGIVRVATRDDEAGMHLYRQVRERHPGGEVVHDRARLKDWKEALRWMDLCPRNPVQADRELRAMWARDDPRKRDHKRDQTPQSRQRDVDRNRDMYGR